MNNSVDDEKLEDDLQPEYDFAKMEGGVRGKYVERCRAGTNLALLEPDVSKAFPTQADVNAALRTLMKVSERQQQS